MLTGFSLGDEWQSRSSVKALFGAARWNQYIMNWSIALDALRQLWETGKVSELKSPFYEPIEKPANK
jgi:hypothetical protein